MTKKESFLEISCKNSYQLGRAIRRFRKRHNLSQTTLSKTAKIRQATVSKAETNLGSAELDTFLAICEALKLEVILREKVRPISYFFTKSKVRNR